MTAALVTVLTFGALLGATPVRVPAQKTALKEEMVDWLRVYPLTPYREDWTMTVEVNDLTKDLPRVMQAIEKSGGQLMVPLQNAAGSATAATQQLSYRLTRKEGTAALKALQKVGRAAPPLIRPTGELLPIVEIDRKISALSRDKAAHEQELSSMPSVSALLNAVLGHLVTAKAVAEKGDVEVILDLTVQGAARP